MFPRALLLCLTLLGLPALAQDAVAELTPEIPASGTRYVLQPQDSQLFIQVFKDRSAVGAPLSHDHAIAAHGWSGEVRWDPSDLSACHVAFSLPVAELDPDPPALREAVGLPGELPEGLREEVKENMLSEKQLWADAHPQISFVSSGCEAAGDFVNVNGHLDIRGVRQPVQARMKVSADAESFTGSGRFEIKATQFGFEPYSAAMGAFRNLDDMRIVIKVAGAAR